jgi:hypothetical protein
MFYCRRGFPIMILGQKLFCISESNLGVSMRIRFPVQLSPFQCLFHAKLAQFASSYSSSTSFTKSPTLLPSSQSFHCPPSLIHLTLPASRTVQLFVTLFSRLRSTLSRSKLIPCASSSLMQLLISSKLRLCSSAQFSTRLRSGMSG